MDILQEFAKQGILIFGMAIIIAVLWRKSEKSNDELIATITKMAMENLSVIKDNTIAFNANTKSNEALIAKIDRLAERGSRNGTV